MNGGNERDISKPFDVLAFTLNAGQKKEIKKEIKSVKKYVASGINFYFITHFLFFLYINSLFFSSFDSLTFLLSHKKWDKEGNRSCEKIGRLKNPLLFIRHSFLFFYISTVFLLFLWHYDFSSVAQKKEIKKEMEVKKYIPPGNDCYITFYINLFSFLTPRFLHQHYLPPQHFGFSSATQKGDKEGNGGEEIYTSKERLLYYFFPWHFDFSSAAQKGDREGNTWKNIYMPPG